MTETFHLPQEQITRPRPTDGERYKVIESTEYWYVVDSVQMRPWLAEFHFDCPDAEKMAKSLASWLNSGPEA